MTESVKVGVQPDASQVQPERDRRIAERYPFSAVAEAVDLGSGVRVTARVSDISSSGCYLDMINVFSPGTSAQISILHANLNFEARATVVYSMPGMGMGVHFNSLAPDMFAVLARWIALVKGESTPSERAPTLNLIAQDSPRVERKILGRLIGLMMRKNILSREEGANLLDELLRENSE